MNPERAENIEKVLDHLWESMRDVKRETISQLGERESCKIADFHGNNWIDILGWVSSKYEISEMNIVSFQFFRLFKEIVWLQFLLLTGNYPVAYRSLRYILEMMCRAYYVATNWPTLTLDQQVDKAKEVEKQVRGWNFVCDVLSKVLSKTKGEIHSQFEPLWDTLNKYVHPSAIQMDWVAKEDFSALVTDSFNETLARAMLKDTDKVLDIAYAILLRSFDKAISPAQQYKFIHEWQECLPNTMAVLNMPVGRSSQKP